MRLVAITPEAVFEGEAEAIEKVLDAGFHTVHLRMPQATADEARTLMRQIPPSYHKRIMLASHYQLDGKFAFGGVHIKQGMAMKPEWETMRKSRSYHCGDDLGGIGDYDYAFISPVFDSISKRGYLRAFTPQDLCRITAASPVAKERLVALGGITAESLPQVAAMGFTGAALLGYLWEGDATLLANRLKKITENAKNL